MTRTEIIEQTKDALGALEETGSDNWTEAERTEYLALAELLHTTEDAPLPPSGSEDLAALEYGDVRHRIIRDRDRSDLYTVQRGSRCWPHGFSWGPGRCAPQMRTKAELLNFAAMHRMTIHFDDAR
jgi:hypothetical protein